MGNWEKLFFLFLLGWELTSKLGTHQEQNNEFETGESGKLSVPISQVGKWRGETLSVSQISFSLVLFLTLSLSSGSCLLHEIAASPLKAAVILQTFWRMSYKPWDKQLEPWGCATTSCFCLGWSSSSSQGLGVPQVQPISWVWYQDSNSFPVRFQCNVPACSPICQRMHNTRLKNVP